MDASISAATLKQSIRNSLSALVIDVRRRAQSKDEVHTWNPALYR
jgi:hypothetical protein